MTTVPAGPQPSNTPVLGDWQPLPTAGAPTPPSTHRTPKTVIALATLTVATGLYAGVGGPLRLLTLDQTGRRVALCTAAAAALVLLAAALLSATRNAVTKAKNSNTEAPSAGQTAVTIGALVCTGVGINTAWGFTHTHLNITDTFTRIALCGTGEIVLIALGLAARDNLKREQAPGMPGLLVWIITGFLAVPAFAEGAATAEGFWQGLTAGAWRAVFGPIGAALLWHLAMGLEIRAANATARSMSVLARLGRRLSQKLLATFGIADTDTTTTELLTRRALTQAANLSDRYAALSEKRKGGWYGRWLLRRLRAALRTARVASDGNQKEALLADLAVSSHAPSLATLKHSSPWSAVTATDSASVAVAPQDDRGATARHATTQTARSAATATDKSTSVTVALPSATGGATRGATEKNATTTPATSATGTSFRSATELVAAPATTSATPEQRVAPRATRHAASARSATAATAATTGNSSSTPYEPGTAKHIVYTLWASAGRRPDGPDIVAALAEAGLPNSPQQARKIRSQVSAENPSLPGLRAAS
ncbi:hypothetical protein [Streptomyces sp. NPDC095613]|uniref:hypothetical protein n=1 Tax=Streptomyces sp. NPDC095613 TaxID=3155540 RepID=UPI0033291694